MLLAQIRPAIVSFILLTALTGILYPLVRDRDRANGIP